jgi:hypothetical protein
MSNQVIQTVIFLRYHGYLSRLHVRVEGVLIPWKPGNLM